MALYYLAGFDTAEIGTFSVVIGGAVGSGTATVTAGTYAPVTMAAVSETSAYTAFASAVQTALNAVVAGWTVSFSTTTLKYTISHATAFTLTWTGTGGTNLKRALGYTADVGSTTSTSSTATPYYVISPAIAARSQMSDVYEPEDIVREAEADDGTPYAVANERGAVGSQVMLSDWTQTMESKAATLARSAASSVPWTWQHFFAHCRGGQPFSVTDGSTTTVHKLRAEGAGFFRNVVSRVVADYDGLWNLRLQTRDFGTL